MQRFTLIHDGSNQGWQAAYLAFHVASRLGAPLQALLVDSVTEKQTLAQRATQIEVGGRAAGVVIETRLVGDFSLEVVSENAAGTDGLFIPARFIPDEKTVSQCLEALSCPLWIVSRTGEVRDIALLVNDLVADEGVIHYSNTLSYRLQEALTVIVGAGEQIPSKHDSDLNWESIPSFSLPEIRTTLNHLKTKLLFLPASNAWVVNKLDCNCVVCPAE